MPNCRVYRDRSITYEADELAESPKYSSEVCPTGMTRFTCEGPAPDPMKLVGRIAKLCPVYLIVDAAAAGAEVTPEMEPAYLFDWLPEVAQEINSPVVLRCTPAQPETLKVVKQAWGKGALVCLYAKQPAKDVLSHLRQTVRHTGNPDAAPRSILGICWPDSLAALLTNGSQGWVDGLFGVFDVALMEMPDGKAWQAFSRPEFRNILDKLGFEQVNRT